MLHRTVRMKCHFVPHIFVEKNVTLRKKTPKFFNGVKVIVVVNGLFMCDYNHLVLDYSVSLCKIIAHMMQYKSCFAMCCDKVISQLASSLLTKASF